MATKIAKETKAVPETAEQKSGKNLIQHASEIGMAVYKNTKTVIAIVLFLACIGGGYWLGNGHGADGVHEEIAAAEASAQAERVMLASIEAARVEALPWYNFWD